VGIDITINSTTLITLLKTRQNYFDGLFNAVNRVYIYEPLIGQEILKRFDLDILRFFKYLGNRVSLHKIDAERLGAEKTGVTPVWTTAFMLGLHYKGYIHFDEFLRDAVENKCLWTEMPVIEEGAGAISSSKFEKSFGVYLNTNKQIMKI
jgi:hypothetical protein